MRPGQAPMRRRCARRRGCGRCPSREGPSSSLRATSTSNLPPPVGSRAVSDYDAIVIGAGHNGLTAAFVMARGGLRVLCLEKNHFIGGMASNTELIRGYPFGPAGSLQVPIPHQIFEDLGLGACPLL